MDSWRRETLRLMQRDMLRTLRTVDGPQGDRILLDGREVLLLCSNDYLGLAGHPALIEASVRAARDFGAGSGGSRLISGSMRIHSILEERIAAFKGTEGALLFNSGYAANTGILQGLFGPGDVVFSDALNHASIIDGCYLSRARTVVYPHGDIDSLEALLEVERPRCRGRVVIVTDGIFSMDGDMAPLRELVRLKHRYGALLMVDDAHGTAVLGERGRGTAEYLECLEEVDLHMGTLGKALGSFGAYLAADRVIIDLLVNRARALIFSTSLPPSVPASAMAALDIVESSEGKDLRQQLMDNRDIFAAGLRSGGVDPPEGVTPILPLVTAEPGITIRTAERLLSRGIFIQGIRPPSVPEGRCRLRATVSALHRPEDLKQSAGIIADILREVRATCLNTLAVKVY